MALLETLWRQATLVQSSSIKDAIGCLDRSALKIAIVLDENDLLLGTITDGDIRRGLLRGLKLTDSAVEIMNKNPVTASADMSRDTVLHLMVENKLQQIPLTNNNALIGLYTWENFAEPIVRKNSMVIMAGGLGTRLRPHTEDCPKPMLLVSGKPMLEHIMLKAIAEGFKHFLVAVNYLGHIIEEYFGSGERYGVRIEYIKESKPLGTAGALSLIQELTDHPFIVTNGDLISEISYGDLLDFHERYAADATMSIRDYEWQIPFGVVKTDGLNVVGFEEKPIFNSRINAGIYVLNPAILGNLIPNSYCDMPELLEQVRINHGSVLAYPMHEPWIDVGRPDDLSRANIATNLKSKI